MLVAHGGTGGFLAHHASHTVTFIGPVIVLAIIGLTSDLRGRRANRTRPATPSSRPLPPFVPAAALSLIAAAIHLIVCPEHFSETVLYGGFFAAITVAQLVWSFLVVRRPSYWLLVSGIVGNCALVALWAVSRTVGVPIGPEAGVIEPVGLLDVVATVCEVGVVVLLARALARRPVAQTS
jgi:hypothetical protein